MPEAFHNADDDKATKLYGLIGYPLTHSFSKIGFDLIYKLEKEEDRKIVAIAKTGMICYDYTVKKITAIPEIALEKLSN